MHPKTPPIQQKPTIIKRGSVSLKIVPGQQIAGGKTYPLFTLVYHLGSQRVRRRFADFAEAKLEAELVATKMTNDEQEALKLSPADRANYVQACGFLRPTNVPLNVAASEYADAAKRLPPGVLIEPTRRETESYW